MKLNELFVKDISRNIQGVIKIGQDEPSVIENELDEYVVTRELSGHFHRFFEGYRKGSFSRTDKIGVWISGFFGSGKSHFLKILSYLLSGNNYDGKRAVSFFDGKIEDPTILADMKAAGDISADVILFNIDAKSDADSKSNKDAIVKVFMKVFNEMQGFCGSMPWIADLERQMTRKGTYEAFKSKYEELSGTPWERGREDFYFESDTIIDALTQTQEMSAEAARHWCESSEASYSLDITAFAQKVREYIEWKSTQLNKKHFVIFLCDEMGQYMGTDGNLLLNLQTVIENLGTECGGRAWVIATGQEDISSIVKETKGGRDAFSKIIGRFDTRLPLSSANADEVIKKRLLAKTESGADSLRLLYADNSAIIKNLITFSQDTPEKKLYKDENDFVDVYPFIPYQFKLLQEVFTGIRQHGASGKHLSEGERSLLNAFQEAAIQFASFDIKAIIPFDAFYRTIETFLDHNIRKVILNAADNSRLQEQDIPVLIVLFMIKYIADKCPANLENLTTLMLQNLTQDRLALRKQIDESLRRLESERLIIRNGEQFIFLTDEEQDINREIREISIDRSEIVEKVGDDALNILFGMNRKYRYNERHDFGFNVFIDDRARGQQKEEINFRILTPYSSHGGDLSVFELSNMSIDSVIAVLPTNLNYMEEMEQALQIETYLRRNAGRSNTDAIEEIIAAKNRETKQRKDRCHDLLTEALKTAVIYAGSQKQDIKEKDPGVRVNDAFHALIEGKYTKLHYIDKPFYTVEDLRTLLKSENNQIKLDGTEDVPNKLAVEDITEYVTRNSYSNTPITVRSLIDCFSRSPYGWKENDTVGVLLTLFKKQEVRLELGAESLVVADPRLVDYVIKRDTNDRVVIKVRVKISNELLINAKDLARDLFSYSAMPNDEDGIMAKFIDQARRELNEKEYCIKDLLSEYQRRKYPGRKVLEDGKKLFENLINIRDVKSFFDYLKTEKESFIDYEEDVTDIRKFFKNQKEIFDRALDYVAMFDNNSSYIIKFEVVSTVKQIKEILDKPSPYSEIYKLPGLTEQFRKHFGEVLEEECKPIQADIKEDFNFICEKCTAIDKKLFEKNFLDNVKQEYDKLFEKIKTTNSILEAIGTGSASKKLRNTFMERFNAALPQDDNAPTVRTKTVSVRSLFSGVNEITNKDEVDSLTEKIKEKLYAELDEDTVISII